MLCNVPKVDITAVIATPGIVRMELWIENKLPDIRCDDGLVEKGNILCRNIRIHTDLC